MGPPFNKSSAVITWQNANFALYCLFGRAVSTYISVSEVITVLIKYYVCKCPSCTRHQYISNHNIEAVKFASYPCLWASWESSSKKTFIGLVLENETEKQQYTFFFSLNIMFADALGPPVTRSSAVITIKMQTQHPFVVLDFEIAIRQTYIVWCHRSDVNLKIYTFFCDKSHNIENVNTVSFCCLWESHTTNIPVHCFNAAGAILESQHTCTVVHKTIMSTDVPGTPVTRSSAAATIISET